MTFFEFFRQKIELLKNNLFFQVFCENASKKVFGRRKREKLARNGLFFENAFFGHENVVLSFFVLSQKKTKKEKELPPDPRGPGRALVLRNSGCLKSRKAFVPIKYRNCSFFSVCYEPLLCCRAAMPMPRGRAEVATEHAFSRRPKTKLEKSTCFLRFLAFSGCESCGVRTAI